MIRFLAAILLVGLAACNTVEGIGRDVSAGGAAITGVSNNARHLPPRPAPQPYYY